MALLRDLVLKLRADSADYRKGLNKAKSDTRTFGTEAQRISRDVQKSFGALGVAISGVAFTSLVKRSIDAADAIAKSAAQANIASKTYQELVFAADKFGISQQNVTKGLQAFTKRLGEARQGTGTLVTFLNKYDQTLLDNITSVKSNEEALDLFLDALKNTENDADRAALAAAGLSRTVGVELANAFKDGGAAVDQWRQKARDLGIVISDDVLARAEETKDTFAAMSQVFQTQAVLAVDQLTPALNAIAIELTDVGKDAADTSPLVDVLTNSFEALSIGLLTSSALIGSVRDTIGGLAAAISFVLEGEFDLAGQVVDEFSSDVEGRIMDLADTIKAIDLFGLNDQPALPATETQGQTAGGGTATVATGLANITGSLEGSNFFGAGLWEFQVQQQIEQQNAALEAQIEFNQQRFENEITAAEQIKDVWLLSIDERIEAEARGQERLLEIERRTAELRENYAADTSSAIMNFTNALYEFSGRKSKALFNLNKAAGISNAIIDTYGAANKALNHPPGPPTTIPIAAAVTAAGLANVAAISSQSFGGGGATPAAGGFGAGTPTSPIITEPEANIEPVPESKTIQINIHGNVVDHDQFAREIIPSIAKAINDGESLEVA